MSYARRHQTELALAKQPAHRRISRHALGFQSRCSTYRSTTVYASCRSTFQDQSMDLHETIMACRACVCTVPWLTLRLFFGLLLIAAAGGDLVVFVSLPLLGPFCSITSSLPLVGVHRIATMRSYLEAQEEVSCSRGCCLVAGIY